METILRLRVSTKKKVFALRWSKQDKILFVETTKKPENGEANKEIFKELKRFFGKEIRIVSGLGSRNKILGINAPEQEVLEKLSAISTN